MLNKHRPKEPIAERALWVFVIGAALICALGFLFGDK